MTCEVNHSVAADSLPKMPAITPRGIMVRAEAKYVKSIVKCMFRKEG